jgi:hypothetical protein
VEGKFMALEQIEVTGRAARHVELAVDALEVAYGDRGS